MTTIPDRHETRLTLLLPLAAVSMLTAGCVSSSDEPEVPEDARQAQVVDGPPPPVPTADDPVGYDTPFVMEGVRTPPTVAADAARLADDARVVGVSVGERHRAYSIEVLSAMTSHVVNDLVDEVPVSVTYCNQSDCARVLTSEEHGTPVDLWLGGWMGGQMSLRYHDLHYPQTSERLPLLDYPFTLTSWREWRELHPDTDVFTGETPPAENAGLPNDPDA